MGRFGEWGTLSVRHYGAMKGALTVDEPRGQRWDLAPDLLSDGPNLVALGPGVLLNRDTAGPASDGRIHIGVVASTHEESRREAQSKVDLARALVQRIADEEERLGSLLRQFWRDLGVRGGRRKRHLHTGHSC